MQKEGAINMDLNIDNIVGKIEHNADKLGLGLGAYMELNRFAKEWETQGYDIHDPIGAAMTIIQGLMSNPHMPNLSHVQTALFNPTGTFQPAAIAAVIGYFLKEVDIMPQTNRIGNALMKGGMGAAEAALIINLLTYSGAAASPLLANKTSSNGNDVPIGPRSVSLATPYREIPIGGAF